MIILLNKNAEIFLVCPIHDNFRLLPRRQNSPEAILAVPSLIIVVSLKFETNFKQRYLWKYKSYKDEWPLVGIVRVCLFQRGVTHVCSLSTFWVISTFLEAYNFRVWQKSLNYEIKLIELSTLQWHISGYIGGTKLSCISMESSKLCLFKDRHKISVAGFIQEMQSFL